MTSVGIRNFVALVCLTLLIAACRIDVDIDSGTAGPGVGDSSTSDASSSGAGDADPEPNYVLRGELDLTVSEINALVTFVEDEAGRPFLEPPVIVAQGIAEYEAGLAPDGEELEDILSQADNEARELQALGLTTQGSQQFTDSVLAVLGSADGILGYYDTEIAELYVPNDVFADDLFRSVLVHELVHSLDGQYIDFTAFEQLIEEGDETGNYEPAAAMRAVVEGRASSIEERWIEATGATIPEGDDLGLAGQVPPAFLVELSIPYVFGAQFIELNGGPGNTWDLLEAPPLWTEEIMIPTIGVGVEPVTDVPVPSADGPVLDEQTFGGADLLTWLVGESLDPDQDLVFQSIIAVDGWAGGSSVLWGDADESCVRIALAADSEDDLAEIQQVVEEWAADGADRSVVAADELVTVTACAPYLP